MPPIHSNSLGMEAGDTMVCEEEAGRGREDVREATGTTGGVDHSPRLHGSLSSHGDGREQAGSL